MYACYLNAWVLPRWGTYKIDQVKPVAIEAWLDEIKRANGTKAKIRNLMSAVFQHAMRYEWTDRDPIQLVRQSAKREKVPEVLELAELQLLLMKLDVRERTLVLLDAATGLRVSELLALRWSDVDFENLELSVNRSIWHPIVGDCKTEASAKPVPLDSYMRRTCSGGAVRVRTQWTTIGSSQVRRSDLMKRYIKPVAWKAGITKNIVWHTFRHSFGTLLKANGGRVEDRSGALETRR